MKKFNTFKIVQLILLIILTAVSLYMLMQPEVKQYIFDSTPATILFIIVWAVLLVTFIFLLIDFSLISSMKMNYHNLYDVAYSDPLSGIPNRFSCDTIIEKYYDKKLPDDIACVMIDLSNLPEINTLYDHRTGNKVLKDFSGILSTAAVSLCFVGRNGGNKFLAIFENCTDEKLNTFLDRVTDRVDQYNQASDSISMEYRIGKAMNRDEHLEQITKLISLANSRIPKSATVEGADSMAMELDYDYLAKLVERTQMGDSDAFAELYTATYQKQYRFAYQYTKDSYLAQDILQDVYILVLKNIHTLKNPRLFVSWLHQITFRICFDTTQKTKRQEQDIQFDTSDEKIPYHRCVDYSTESNPEKYALTKDTQQQLINSIYSLPQQFAQPIIMRYYNNMAIDEIADAMDCSRSTIKRRLHKGQKLLEAKLGKEKGGISFV